MPTRRVSVKARPLAKSLAKLSSAAAILSALAASTSDAQTVTWDAGSGLDFLWNTNTNWSADALPTATDAVIFPSVIPNPATLPNPSTITLGAGSQALSLDFQNSYTLTGGDLTLGALGNVNVAPTFTSSINSALLGAGGITKTGTGTLALGGVNLFTGAIDITAGTLSFTADNNLGAATAINLSNGAVLSYANTAAQATLGATRIITVGTGGGTFSVPNATPAITTSKITIGGANQIAGTGTFTKSGAGLLTATGANATFTGDWVVSGGVLETTSGALNNRVISIAGAGATTSSATTGELATNSDLSQAITLNGGVLSPVNGNRIISGSVSVAANSAIALRDFYSTGVARSMTVSGPITGSGNVTVAGATAAGGVLTLTGSRAAHSGQIIAGTNTAVVFSNPSTISSGGIGLTGGQAQIRAINSAVGTAGTQGLNATYYNFGSNPGTGANQFAADLLYLAPRAFTRTDLNVNLPNSGSGDWPIIPVQGFGTGFAPAGAQNDGVMWKGLLNITNAGTYQFSGTNDDNLVLYIDGQQIGTLGVIATNTNIGSAVSLSAGAHSIVVKHTQGGGGGYATLSYNGGAGSDAPATALIPSTAFTTGSLVAIDLGPMSVAGGTVDIIGPSSTSNLTLGNGTFTLTSPTIDNLTIGTTTINAATPTLAPTTGAMIFTGAIGQDVAGRALNFAGPYYAEFQGVNTYTGTTTVTGGQLRLNTAGGNSIAGNLTVNAANGNGALNNVVLQQSNQIADTSVVTMTQGILSLGSNSDTVSGLAMNGGAITGSGTLTVTNAPTFTAGTISANLAGAFPLNKTTAGVATLSGNNTYTGLTSVSAGVLNASGPNALGAGGVGNETTVATGATLRSFGGIGATEDLTIGGAGLAGDSNEAALRNLGGISQFGKLTTNAASTLRVDSGEVIVNGALDVTAGPLTKTGNGILTFASNQATFPTVTHLGGAIGFSGPQSFGTAAVPAGLAYAFNSNPGAGVTSVTVPSGAAVIGNYAVDNAFLAKINPASTGTLLLGADNSNALSLASVNLSLGAKGLVRYSGVLTPNAAGYSFGGIAGQGSTITGLNELTVSSVLGGTASLNVSGGLVQLSGVNTFTGTVNVTGGTLRTLNNTELGNAANGISLNGGTLQAIAQVDNTGAPLFSVFGNQVTEGYRTITVGASGGTIDVPARQLGGNGFAITGNNALTGTGNLNKTGLGYLFITSASNLTGSLTIAPNGGQLDVRSGGTLTSLTGPITIGQSGVLNVDGQNGLGQRQIAAGSGLTAFTDRIANASTINLNGGSLNFTSRAGTLSNAETFGTLNLGVGQSALNATSNSGGNSSSLITFGSLTRSVGSTVRFGGTPGTYGAVTANNTTYLVTGQAAAPIIPFATQFGTNFVAYNATTGVINPTLTAATAVAQFVPANIADQTGDVTLTAAATEVIGLRQSGNAARVLSFTNQNDTLFLNSGAYLSDGNNQTRTIGAGGAAVATNTQGRLTAGPSTGNASPRELFLHNNSNTLTVNSTIVDNNGQAVTVVKDLDGTVTLRPNINMTATWVANTNVITVADTSILKVGQPVIGIGNVAFVAQILSPTTFAGNGAPNNAGTAANVNIGMSNTFTGGVFHTRGILNSSSVGALGDVLATNNPTVTVKNAVLNLNNIGGVNGTVPGGYTGPVYTTPDNGAIFLLAGSGTAAGQYNTNTDRFSISAGSTIGGTQNTAGAGLNSLTRISSPTAFTSGGQVYLEPGAIVRHNLTNAPNQGTGTLTIQSLGTNADLFFAPNNFGGVNQTITVGAGTPWRGLSSERANLTWTGGTIFANSDFVLQGLLRDGGYAQLILGGNSTAGGNIGGVQIVNNTSGPINASVIGNVTINEDEPVSMPSNLTFVLTPGSIFQPNTSQALGFGSSQAKVLVQAGATLDPGNYVSLGATANTTRNPDGSLNGFQNLPYALPSPVNAQVTVEAGGRFLINDASGIGSAANGSYTLKANSVLDIGNTNAFFGRGAYGLTQTGPLDTTGVANPGQFVYEDGAIARINADNVYKLSQFLPTSDAVIEVVGATRLLTNQNNPFIIPAVGTPTIAPENITIANGLMLTGDNVDRQISEGRGRIILGEGGTLAGTTQTYLNIQEGIEVLPGANITIGSTKWVSGNPKLGGIQLLGPNSNIIPTTATISMLSGTQFAFGAVNVWPDNRQIDLPLAVTAFPSSGALALQPGTGNSLLLNVANFMEYVGHVTGSGAVIANQGGTALAINATSDFSSNVVFKNTNGQQPSLMKAGPATLTLTGNSDSQGLLVSQQGTVVVSNGTGDWNEIRPQRGASIVVDNSVNPTNNRLGLPGFLVGQGGTFELKGNATTAVTESFNALASGAGNFIGQTQNSMISTLKVTPGAANTTLQFLSIENYVSAGQRLASYVVSSPTVANGPMTYSTASAIVPNVGNSGNGLVEVAVPNFGGGVGNTGLLSGAIFGSSGTPVMAIRNDLLGDANGDGIPEGLVSQDGVNYVSTNTSGTNLITGLPTTTGLSVGMLVTGTGISPGTRIQTIASGTSVTLTNNTSAAATNLNVIVGGLRNLADSEYGSSFRDNQNVGLNVKVSGANSLTGDTRVQTLTMTPGSSLNINGTLPNNATSSRLLLNSSAVFVQPGGTATINGSTSGNTESYLQFIGGSGLFLHTWGNLNLNTKVFSDIGVIKTGPGTLSFGPGAFEGFRGTFQLDGGIVNLAADNSVQNVRQQSGSSGTNFYINAGTLNLNGNSQMVNLLNSASELPGQGGTISSVTSASITNVGGGRFAGKLDGAITLDKAGNNTLLLTDAQTYTGSTIVRAGTLSLRDSAQLSPSAGLVSIRNATLQLDNGYLSNVPNRINPATPVEMSGGTLNLTGAAGQVASQTINSLALVGGLNTFTSNAGGSGANEVSLGNLVRAAGSGATLNFSQTYGFVGTAGNTTTAIRNFIGNVNGSPLALNDGIVGGWAIVNGDHFATYRAATGVGAYSNTADGYANYESGDATTAAATQNVNDGAARTFATTKTINAWRIAPNAAVTMTVNAGVGLTIDSGGLLTNNNNTTTFASGGAGSSITSNSGELDVWVNQNTTVINVPIAGSIDLVKSGPGTLTLGAVNTHTGTTFATGGTLNLSLAGADAGTNVTIPGRLVINAATVTETVANQMSASTDVVVGGGGRLNMMNAAGITENIRSLTMLDGSSGTGTANGLDRTASQLGSTINLTGANAITSTNTNPVTGVPFIGGFAGSIAFSNAAGATLNINSPVDVNGVLAVGLRFGARITNVPTGVAGGGLIKAGTGLLTLDPDQNPTFPTGNTVVGSAQITGMSSTAGLAPGQQITGTNIPAGAYIISVDSASQITISANATVAGATGTITGQVYNLFNSPTTLTDVFNIQSGIVRADRNGSLGSPFANTTVQNGAVLLGSNTANQIITGSVTLKDGATLGATINSFTLGAATDVAANQTILNVPSGTATIVANDYFVQSSNNGNITINGKLTGAGNLNLYGPQITQGNGGGGVITLGNPIVSGVGSNDYSGTINVGTNAILQNQIALIAKNTTVARATGSALGTATINLNGGRLRFRDDATSGATAVSNTPVTFGNNITLTANSYLDAGRANATDTGTANTIGLGTLTVSSGTRVLTVDSNTGTGAGAGLGNYIVDFTSLNANGGTFVKGGAGRVSIGSVSAGSSIAIAGPSNNTLAPTFNANGGQNLILPNSASFANLSVSGSMITEPSKTVNLSGALTVTANAGNISGMLALTNTTTLTAGTVVNDGLIGPTGGDVILNATGFSGSGRYQTTTAVQPASGAATVNNNLTLNGNFTAGAPKISGGTGPNDVVTVKGTSNVFTGTAEVQSGTLRFNPTANATSSGSIRVLGAASSAAGASSAPISAVTGTLLFDSGASTIAHTGNITNSGVVRVGSGSATVNGTIGGPATEYVPGLLEGLVAVNALDATTARPANPGNFGVQMEPRMLQTNIVTQNALTGHTDNDTWIYTGYVKDDDGVFSFAENIDDRAAVWIDGALVLNAVNGGTSRVVSTAYKDGQAGTGALTAGSNLGTPSQNFGAGITLPGFGGGWHLIEIRMNNGAGGSGPIAGNGFGVNYGFGYKNGIAALDGADMIKPIDNGTGNLFVTPVNAKGAIEVGASGNTSLVSLTAGRVTSTSVITLNGGTTGASPAKLALTATGAHDADGLTVAGGANSFANVDLANNSTLTVGTLTVPTGGQLTLNLDGNSGTLAVSNTHALASTSKVILESGTLKFNGTGGAVGAEVQVFGGATADIGGSLTGSVSVIGGTIKGSGTVLGPVTLVAGATISPGASPGILTVDTIAADASSDFQFEIGGTVAGTTYDQLKVTTNDFSLGSAQLSLAITSPLVVNQVMTIVLNSGGDTDFGMFAGLTSGSNISLPGGTQVRISYFDDPFTPTFETAGANMTNVSLLVTIPEPGSAALLLGGLGSIFAIRRRRKS